jgi:hypothetical protein
LLLFAGGYSFFRWRRTRGPLVLAPGSQPSGPYRTSAHGPWLHRMWLHPAPRATRAATHLWIVLAQHLVSPFTSSSLTGIIRPRRLPLLHTATVTAATTPRVTVADVADVSLAPPSLAHALPRHLPPPSPPLPPPPTSLLLSARELIARRRRPRARRSRQTLT